MPRFDITFQFKEDHEDAAIRMWIDDATAAQLDSETEIPVARSGRLFRATVDHGQPGAAGCFWLRIAIVGKPGASWALEVRQQGIQQSLIFSDGDVLALPKEWLVATCYPRRAARRGLAAVA